MFQAGRPSFSVLGKKEWLYLGDRKEAIGAQGIVQEIIDLGKKLKVNSISWEDVEVLQKAEEWHNITLVYKRNLATLWRDDRFADGQEWEQEN